MVPYIPIEELHYGLTAAFDETELKRLLRSRFAINLDDLAPRAPLPDRVFAVIEAAERAGWLQELVEAAYRARPQNPAIKTVYEKFGLAPQATVQQAGVSTTPAPTDLTSGGFESVVRQRLPYLDFELWTVKAARVSDRVCRVEVKGGVTMGTGFLVGPDALLTCDYVLDELLRNKVSPEQVQFRFEYKVLVDGTRSEGVVVGLHPTDWLIDSSPYAPGEAERPDVVPTADQLGYALVRLDRPVGSEPPGRARGGDPRGWIWVPHTAPPLNPRTPVIIAHYPEGRPLKITFDSAGMLGPNTNGTRVRYTAQTEPGSGGAPCFDMDWNLFAVHQLAARGANWSVAYRQGILTAAIRARLERLGKAGALGGESP